MSEIPYNNLKKICSKGIPTIYIFQHYETFFKNFEKILFNISLLTFSFLPQETTRSNWL